MGEDAILRMGTATITGGDLEMVAVVGLVAAGFGFFQWARWRLREWRIRRAVARGDHDHGALLSLDHEADNAPRSLAGALFAVGLVAFGYLALLIFERNFADDVARLLGERFAWAGMPLAVLLVGACFWAVDRIRRNAMTPEELAALEEEEEHRRWLRSIDGDSMPGLAAAIALGAGVLVAIFALIEAITPV